MALRAPRNLLAGRLLLPVGSQGVSIAKRAAAAIQHGRILLPAVEVVSYNVELKDDEGFIGDRASKGSFREFIENWRTPMRDMGQDPFGEEATAKIAKKRPRRTPRKRGCRSSRRHPERDRIVRARACDCDPPLPEA
jgi:non-canonical (house-cleaning) NTP pyrophosphatase